MRFIRFVLAGCRPDSDGVFTLAYAFETLVRRPSMSPDSPERPSDAKGV